MTQILQSLRYGTIPYHIGEECLPYIYFLVASLTNKNINAGKKHETGTIRDPKLFLSGGQAYNARVKDTLALTGEQPVFPGTSWLRNNYYLLIGIVLFKDGGY